MTGDKPYSPSCDRNRDPILEVLRFHLRGLHPQDRPQVLEVGSGTGQHAVYFAEALPQLVWQCSDRMENLDGIRQWLDEAALPNTPEPLLLDVGGEWPARIFDVVFSANTLHIMAWETVGEFFKGVDAVLASHGMLLVYGPFNRGGEYSSDSNREFDGWLKARGPQSGIRDFEAVDALARAIGLQLIEDVAMPANNRCLVWQRIPTSTSAARPAHAST